MEKKVNFVQGMYPEASHFNTIQESVESADRRIGKATAGKGIVSGFNLRIAGNTAYITSGEAFDVSGRQVHHSGDDIEIDLSGITRPNAGYYKWISFFISFSIKPSGDVYDDSNGRHDLYHEETVTAHYIEGEIEGEEEEMKESAERPDIGDKILVGEILIDAMTPFEGFVPSLLRRSTVLPSTALKIAIDDIIAKNSPIIYKKNPFSYDKNILVVRKNSVFATLPGWKESFIADIELSENNLDTSSFMVGNDYYIHYVYQNETGKFVISKNNTCDYGIKIGGFHYGHIRKVSNDGLWIPVDPNGFDLSMSGVTPWENNVTIGIVPNSVWDLKNRPKSNPEGMVKVGDIWVDIYLASSPSGVFFEREIEGLHVAIGTLESKYGLHPVTGNNGFNWYNFVELATRSKKRLLTYNEWIKAVYGNPQGEDNSDQYGWTKTTNDSPTRTGCSVNVLNGVYDPVTGMKPYAISAYNVVDGVGNVPEWTSNLVLNWEGVQNPDWYDFIFEGRKGQYYGTSDDQVRAICAGGNYNDGVKAGCRSLTWSRCIWILSPVGARFASESL